jgi:hypothetical protein
MRKLLALYRLEPSPVLGASAGFAFGDLVAGQEEGSRLQGESCEQLLNVESGRRSVARQVCEGLFRSAGRVRERRQNAAFRQIVR